MSVDTPATIAIFGAGPLGLEAALYARFLGYNVLLYERGTVAEHVRRCGQVRLFSPFGACHSSLGRNALLAQQDDFSFPADDALLTGNEWLERYLQPLAETDLLADHLRLQTEVLGVTRSELLKNDATSADERAEWTFRIVWRKADGASGSDEADIVIDTTGVWSHPNWAGAGGLPAAGEQEARAVGGIETGLPDILGRERPSYAGKHTLLIGSGHSAATNAIALARLANDAPETKITWITRREGPASGGAIKRIANDPLPARDELAQQANALLTTGHPAITFCPATTLAGIRRTGNGAWDVELAGARTESITCDRVLANVGHQPAVDLFRELQVQLCPATESPVKVPGDPLGIRTTEPNFYILGRKKFGRQSGCTFADGLTQIRDLFTIIGERETLDLYASNRRRT